MNWGDQASGLRQRRPGERAKSVSFDDISVSCSSATALTRARLDWAFARTDTVFYVTGQTTLPHCICNRLEMGSHAR